MRFPGHLLLGAVLAGPAATARGESPAGGDTTVHLSSREAFSQPLANLQGARRTPFFVGNSFFNQNWVAAPASTAARDGLGPLFSARSCSACHFKDGRGAPPDPGQPFSTMVLRISLPGGGPHGSPLPDPTYGTQVQHLALPGIPPEARVHADYQTISGTFADGESYTLRRPVYRLEGPGYGPFAPELRMSPRVAPVVFGMGLLEAVPEATLAALEDPDDRDGNGISGRLHRVWDGKSGRHLIGRFGWKAEQPSIPLQVAAAFHDDLGLTTSLIPRENHQPAQKAAAAATSGGSPEVSDSIFDSVVYYSRTLAVPAARDTADPDVRRGRELFGALRCDACHTPELKTGEWPEFPELSGQTIRPYTDLLLHDLGEGLDDGRPVFGASGREWRTPPLWGIGLVPKVNGHTFFLHDGRARNLTEAILWHGGEARPSREKFHALPKADRQALLRFLESL